MWPIPSHDTCNVPIPTPRGLTDACENITSFAGGGVGTSHASSTYPTPPLGYPTPTPRISYPLAIPYTPPVYWHQVVTTKAGASAWWITRFPKIIHRHVMTFLNTRDGSTNRLRFFFSIAKPEVVLLEIDRSRGKKWVVSFRGFNLFMPHRKIY